MISLSPGPDTFAGIGTGWLSAGEVIPCEYSRPLELHVILLVFLEVKFGALVYTETSIASLYWQNVLFIYAQVSSFRGVEHILDNFFIERRSNGLW